MTASRGSAIKRIGSLPWYSGGTYVVVLLAMAFASWRIWTLDLATATEKAPRDYAADLNQPGTAAVGTVVDQFGYAVTRARVILDVYGQTSQKLFSRSLLVTSGVFVIRKQDLPNQPEL